MTFSSHDLQDEGVTTDNFARLTNERGRCTDLLVSFEKGRRSGKKWEWEWKWGWLVGAGET
jgi:hypothetical protein